MELHKLTFARLDQPDLAGDDPGVTVWEGAKNKPRVTAKREGEWCWFRIDTLATYRFPATSADLTVSCVADPDHGSSKATVVDGYFRSVVPLALQVYGLEAMHGTAIETGAGVVALCGRSHAGKTTLTYALSRRGYRVLADDGLVIDATAGVALQPIPFALMIRESAAEHFGAPVRERVTVAGGEAPLLTVPPVPLAAVVQLNRVESEETRLQLLSKRDAYLRLLGHSYVFSLDEPSRKGRMMSAYARFADAVPVYELTYPDGLDRLDDAVLAIEQLVASLPLR